MKQRDPLADGMQRETDVIFHGQCIVLLIIIFIATFGE